MNIRPLHTLRPAEVADPAHAAAERGEPLASANPFDANSDQHKHFSAAYHERERDLQSIDCAA